MEKTAATEDKKVAGPYREGIPYKANVLQ